MYFSLMALPTTEQPHIGCSGNSSWVEGRIVAREEPDQAQILSPVSLVSQLEHSRAGMLMEVVLVAY